MANCRKTNRNSTCDSSLEKIETQRIACKPFRLCVGFGRELVFDGDCLSVEGTPQIQDGVYTQVVVQNGCIVNAQQAELPILTPAPCTPNPADCGGSGGSGGAIPLTPGACNLIQRQADGSYQAVLSVEPGDGVSVTGCGTTSSPLQITITKGDTVISMETATADWIRVDGDGSVGNAFRIGHVQPDANVAGTFMGLTFDSAGHLVAQQDVEVTGVQSLVQGPGITLSGTAGVYTIAHAETGADAGTALIGAFLVTTDMNGHVSAMERQLTVEAGDYDCYYNTLTINEFGSVEKVVPKSPRPNDSFSKLFVPGRSTTTMQFTTGIDGCFRVRYRGDLGDAPTITTGTGMVALPAGYQLLIDGQAVQGFIFASGGRIAGLESMTSAVYSAGDHIVQIISADPFADNGVLDVLLVTQGV